MEIAVIGAGFAGLSAAISLSEAGHRVSIFEIEDQPGGLAMGFRDPRWDWSLEKHYHHLFISDWAIRRLAEKIGHPIVFTRPLTSTYVGGHIYQLDSPLSLLRFPPLSPVDRVRTAASLGYLRFVPWWQPLESITAEKYIKATAGEASWKILWEPLFRGKFWHYSDRISAAWFWSRISKRSANLGYPSGGFASLAQSLAVYAQKLGTTIHYQTPISRIHPEKSGLSLVIGRRIRRFSAVICTLPLPQFFRLTPSLPSDYKTQYGRLMGIGAVNLVLALKHQFLRDTYWLNINDRRMPFLALVEHTNYQDAGHYAGDRLLYIGNYLPPDHAFFKHSPARLVSLFTPHLKKINPRFNAGWIKSAWVFPAPFAQPIVTPDYSRLIPPFTTPIPGLYLANIQQVYPHDRGTNYAVELGSRVAQHVLGF